MAQAKVVGNELKTIKNYLLVDFETVLVIEKKSVKDHEN